ncbi:MAG: class I SAM-dependent methyltransferase [Thermoplasmata archaeon]|jgi:ubiquinone/menaquinone biosynthesis C-methylase UbiE
MAEMNRVSRWFVNASTTRRSIRMLDSIGSHLNLPPSARILELGSGQGALSALLQERYHPGRLVVTDFDPKQVEAARAYLCKRFGNLPSTVNLRQVDAKALPFDDGSFDGVFAILMLHHVEAHLTEYRQRPEALREIRRVLAPGGFIVFSDFVRTRDLRRTLTELGFVPLLEKPGWAGRYLGVFRSPA